MKIIVLVKQVPDTTEMKIDKETGTLIRTGVPTIVNPDDLAAVEEALKLKDKHGAFVHVVTMGPMQAVDMMRELYGMGVDKCTLVSDRAFAGSDTWATSNTLAKAVSLQEYDLIIAGRQAIDGDTAQVGPQVAEKLGLPQVTYVEEICECCDGKIVVSRAYEDYSEVLEVKLPCLITTLQTMNKPRYQRVGLLWDSFKREVEVITNEQLGLDSSHTGLSGSPTQVKKTFPREVTNSNEVLTLSAQETAQHIAKLIEPFVKGE